jgi:CubicO group peptidase (beta-lactamase class C family)
VRGFERHGKGGITIRQVLTHRAGIPALPGARFSLDLLADPAHILELLCDARPLSAPGRKLAYHALTGGFLLGAVIAEATGLSAGAFLQQEVSRPLGLPDFRYGVEPSRIAEVAENALTGLPLPIVSWLFSRSVGLSLDQAVSAANDPRFLTAEVPSGNLITSPREACRFFEALRQGGSLDGVRVFDPRTIRRATAEQSMLQIDGSIGLPVRYSMGFILGDDHLSPYGPRTEQAFGHVGFSNVLVWADPAREISVAYLNTGKPFVTAGQLAFYDVPRTISAAFAR